MPDVVEERRGDQGLGRAGAHGLPGRLERMLGLRDLLSRVGGGASRLVELHDPVDDGAHRASPFDAGAVTGARAAAQPSADSRAGASRPEAPRNRTPARTFTAK